MPRKASRTLRIVDINPALALAETMANSAKDLAKEMAKHEEDYKAKRACVKEPVQETPVPLVEPLFPRLVLFDADLANCPLCGEERSHPHTYYEGTDPKTLLGPCPICYVCKHCNFQAVHKRVRQIALVDRNGVPQCPQCRKPDRSIIRDRVQHLFVHDATDNTPTAKFEVIGDDLVLRFSCPKTHGQ